MKLILKFGECFPRNRLKETNKRKSFVEQILRHSPKLAFAVCLISFIPISLLAKPYETAEIPTPKQQIPNTKIKVFSQLGATKKEIIMPENETESLICDFDDSSSSRTYVKPFNKIITGQERCSETNPRILLPP